MIQFIHVAHAAVDGKARIVAKELVAKINDAILFPLIALLMAIAFLMFLWGVFEFVKNADNQTARETGRRHLLFGVIGMLIMLSAYAILSIAAGTFGLQGTLQDAHDPISPFATDVSPRPPSRPGFNPAGYVPENDTTWSGDTADSFGGDSGYTAPSDTPPDMMTDIGTGNFGQTNDNGGVVPYIPSSPDAFIPPTRLAQPLTPAEEQLYDRYVESYSTASLPGRTQSEESTDIQNILNEYANFGVTEVVFMTDLYTTTGTQQSVGALSQQESLCQKKGGQLVLESGANRVTSRSVYACLR